MKPSPSTKRAVAAMVHFGAMVGEAAKAAGVNENTLRTNLAKDHYREWLRDCTEALYRDVTFEAVSTVRELARSAKTESVRLRAAQDLLDRAERNSRTVRDAITGTASQTKLTIEINVPPSSAAPSDGPVSPGEGDEDAKALVINGVSRRV